MDLNTIVNIIVFFVLPWAVPLLLTLCAYWYRRLIAALPVAQRAEAVRLTQMGVAWAEQALGSTPGTAKREEAMTKITAMLASAKIVVSPHLIDMALEEAVHAMNTAPDPLLAVPYPVSPPPLPSVGGVPPRPAPQPIILTTSSPTSAAAQQP